MDISQQKKGGEGHLKKSFLSVLTRTGIINFHFYDLRHTFASQLVMSGVDLKIVWELLGHKSLEMTLRYAHLSPDHKKRAIDVLGKRIDTFGTPGMRSEKVDEKRSLQVIENKVG